MFVNYINIIVNDDDEAYQKRNYESLRDYGMHVLNARISDISATGRRIVPMNIVECYDSYQVRPVMCNSSTWYKRCVLSLTLWYSLAVKPELPEVKTDDNKK